MYPIHTLPAGPTTTLMIVGTGVLMRRLPCLWCGVFRWGCVVLRRMGDAERDGNRIIATLANATAGAAGPVEGKQHHP